MEADRTFRGRGAVAAGVHGAILVMRSSADENGVVGMSLDVLLQVLGALERFAAEVALMRLQRNVNADVGRDVVTLDSCGATRVPLAGEVQVVGALPANMLLTKMVLGAGQRKINELDFKGIGLRRGSRRSGSARCNQNPSGR